MKTIFSYFRPASGQIKSGNYKTTLLLLMLIWFIINLIQAIYTEVLSDEAYYGLFGKYLDWGYFDHPPMVALLIRVSSLFFTGNLGLRFMTILLQPFTLYLIWKISDSGNPDSRKVITLFIIAGSISLFSVYGVFAAPDSPLLFFTALFLFVYKRFINGYSWSAVLLLSVSMTGLIYSKYQAVLVIGFVILSNLRLLRIYRFWVAGIITLVLLSPHIYWQISNNFPGFQYHLIDRSEGLRWNFLIEYLPNQIAVFNPLILGAVIYVFFKYRSADQFERSLRFQIIGILIFFWFISFSGHVEPHWTIVCSIPMIVILSDKSNSNPSLSGYARRYLLPSILLFLIIRILLMTDLRFIKYLAFNGKEEKYKVIESEAGELPVIFTGSFQRPSYYTFFTGKEAMAISSLYSRQTQFDIWQFERKYHNKPAFICLNPKNNSQIYFSDTLQFGGFITDSLQTVNRMKIYFSLSKTIFNTGDSLNIAFRVYNGYNHDIDFNHHRFPVELCMVFLKREEVYVHKVSPDKPIGIVPAGDTVSGIVYGEIPSLSDGNYHFGFSLNTIFGPSLNSRFMKIRINND